MRVRRASSTDRTMLAWVGALALVTVGATLSASHSAALPRDDQRDHRPPGELPATTLIFGDASGVGRVFHTSADHAYSVKLPLGYPQRDYRRWETGPLYGDLVRAGDRLVVSVAPHNAAAPARLLSVSVDLRATAARDLGHYSGYFASRSGRRLWAVQPPRGRKARYSVVELDPDTGAELTTPLKIEDGRAPIAQLSAGFLTEAAAANDSASTLAIVDAHTGRLRRTITRHASQDSPVLAAAGHTVVWQGPGSCAVCTIRILDLRDDSVRTVRWHAPQRYVCDDGALAPDQRRLAIVFGCRRPDLYRNSPIIVVNTATGHVQEVPNSNHFDAGPAGWTANSDWLIWQATTDRADDMRAFRIGARAPNDFDAHERGNSFEQALQDRSLDR